MFGNEFEKAFSDFMERREYDQAENALFSMVRIAFVAGWLAAGGEPAYRAAASGMTDGMEFNYQTLDKMFAERQGG